MQDKDSLGNILTQEQVEFFKNSKVRDSSNNLLVCYHFTNKEFDTFKYYKNARNGRLNFGKAFYFTNIADDENVRGYGSIRKDCYLNLVNPLIVDAKGTGVKERPTNFDGYRNGYVPEGDPTWHKEWYKYMKDNNLILQDYAYELYFHKAHKQCNDGIIIYNVADYSGSQSSKYSTLMTVYIAFEENQIKAITNKNPTSKKNINEKIIQRGEDSYNYSNKFDNLAGKFFFGDNQWKKVDWDDADKDGYYGDLVEYDLSKDAKIYRGYSSEDYCDKHNLYDVKDNGLKKILISSGLKDEYIKKYENQDLTLNEISKEDLPFKTNDANSWFACFQYMAKKDLEKKGYDGARWEHEDDVTPHQYQIWNLDKVKKITNESLLLEKTRQDLISKSKSGKAYSKKNQAKGKNRWERRRYSQIANSVRDYNDINMDAFWKGDILDFKIKVKGETDNYIISITFEKILDELQREVRANNNKLEFKCVLRALLKAFNGEDVYMSCSCPDWNYRFAHNATVDRYNAGVPEMRPNRFLWTNSQDDMGAGCKHTNLVLSNTDWMMKVASVINNYIKWTKENMERNYADYIFPKVYGMPYNRAVQLSLFDDPEDNGLLPSDQETITKVIDKSLQGKDEKGRWVKDNEFRFQKKDSTKYPEDNDNQIKLNFEKEQNKRLKQPEEEEEIEIETEEEKERNDRYQQ